MDKDTISYSEMSTWALCRQKWNYSYGMRLSPKRRARAPAIGTCGHIALGAHLQGEDWEKAVDEWLVSYISETDLFDEEIEESLEIGDLIKSIIPRYLKHFNDQWTPVMVEDRFEIGLSGTATRFMGYMDAVVKATDGKLWLLEHKFPKRFKSDNDIELNAQLGMYAHACHRLGFPVVGVIYDQLLARMPEIPKVNKNGSLSKAQTYTNWETYLAMINSLGLDENDYTEMRAKLSGNDFFRRTYVYKTPAELKIVGKNITRKVWDARRKKKHIYRSESPMNCGWCSYRELCMEEAKGRDVSDIIATDFEPKRSRRKEEGKDDTTNGQTGT